MERDCVFQEPKELSRLATQNDLLAPWEAPIYRRVLAGRGLCVLDIGTNDGSKAIDRFSRENISRMIGLEHDATLVSRAQARCAGEEFSFFRCDVEEADFPQQLLAIMERTGIEAFDVIHISLLLMHLAQPEVLLRQLRKFLVPGGRVLIIEPDDSVTAMTPDREGLFRDFRHIHELEPLSGDRTCARWLPQVLEEIGYQNICSETGIFSGCGQDLQRKQAVFDVLCSYVREDIVQLRLWEPDNALYREWGRWMDAHFDDLIRQIFDPGTELSMGVAAITCERGTL